tara:strand:- start:5338 stop:6591 length:1254 start_codon:yes stop_codon:yes gene_type:complete
MRFFWKFIKRQTVQIRNGGALTISNKLKKIYPHIIFFPLYVLAFPIVIFIRLLAPIILIRWYGIVASRIGTFAANIELYLCEKECGINVPNKSHFDIIFIEQLPVCNKQLYLMWKRVLRIWPRFIFYPIMIVNKIIPGGGSHEFSVSSIDRDVNNLYDKTSPHLFFTKEEEEKGAQGLLDLGIPKKSKFVCLIVRDNAYLPNLDYHSYRDGDINSYVLAAEELASRGFYVIRMGVMVNQPINSQNSKIIDYASNGSRSDFMDIYLGAKCTFCLTSATGYDAIPTIFRKPLALVSVPVGYISTFSKNFLSITKHHMSLIDGHELTFDEIFDKNVAFALSSENFKENEVYLVDNSPEEIRDLAIEMDDHINGYLDQESEDRKDIYKKKYLNYLNKDQKKLHGNIKSLFSSRFLEKNTFF